MNKAKATTDRSVVLAYVPSSKKGKDPYPIRLAGTAVYCVCDGFHYRHDCSHMKRFKDAMKLIFETGNVLKLDKE